jgi:hypothetical protein
VFPAILWNNDFSNTVVYVRANTNILDAADRLGATWIYANDKESAPRLRASGRWQEIGPLYVERWGTAFRRAK